MSPRLNGVEQTVAGLREGEALGCGRIDRYDFQSGLFYSPLSYTPVQTQRWRNERFAFPDDDWVDQAIRNLVRQEFRRGGKLPRTPPQITVGEAQEVDALETFTRLRDQYEQIVYSPETESILSRTASDPLETRLFELLSMEGLAGRELRRFFTSSSFANHLDENVDLNVGIRMVLPALPFRDQNPFRTRDAPPDITAGEVLFLLQLHAIALAIYQVVPTGSNCIILADGTAYASALGVDERDAQGYLDNLRAVRSALNLDRTISLLDLRDLMRTAATWRPGVPLSDAVASHIADSLARLRAEGTADETFGSLVEGIKWNMNLKPFIKDEGDEHQVWTWLVSDPGEGNRERPDLDEAASTAALSYAAANLAEKFMEIARTRLPGCVRFTTHPKEGQLPVPRRGSVSVWNGISYLRPSGTARDFRVEPLFRLDGRHLTPIVNSANVRQVLYYVIQE